MLRYLMSVACAVCVTVAPAIAQRGGHNGFPVLAPSAPQHGGFGPRGEHRRPFPGSFFLGTPFWTDDYYSYYPNDPAAANYVVPAPAKPLEYPKSLAPLMIELQGDHYVRRSLDESSTSPPESVTAAYVAKASSAATRASSARANPTQAGVSAPSPVLNEPPTVFVFRDGHREESSDYSIISGVIYSRGDYWTSGAWSKKILIADLDVPATLHANHEHGVPFRLPSAPNEVITRP